MIPWAVDADNKRLNKSLKKYRSDRRIMDSFERAIATLSMSGDPAAAGSRKRGRLDGFYSYSLTRSHRLIYEIDYGERVIRVINLGDHKEVYGRDSRA